MKWKPAGALLLAATLFALSACSDGQAAPPPTIGDGAGGSDDAASASPSDEAGAHASASPTEEEPFDEDGHVAMPGDVRVSGKDKQDVVDAWLAYWQVRMDAFSTPEVDPVALGAVAQGDAASQVVSYVDYLQQKGLHTEGDLRFDVGSVRLRGDTAVLRSCVTNQSVDRRPNGRAAEPLTPFYEFQGHLTRVADSWSVSRVVDTGSGPC